MSTMNFADEVVAQDELEGLPGPSENVSDRELKMASQLIDSLSTTFDPDKYEDTYREKVIELIEKKAEGKEIVAPKETKAASPVVDLMAALEASLAAAKGDSKLKGTGKAPAKGDDDEAGQGKAGRKAS